MIWTKIYFTIVLTLLLHFFVSIFYGIFIDEFDPPWWRHPATSLLSLLPIFFITFLGAIWFL